MPIIDYFKTLKFSELVADYRTQVCAHQELEYSPEIKRYFQDKAASHNEIPFAADYSHEPDQIQKSKNLINGLYYAEQFFLKLEELPDQLLATILGSNEVVELAYKAGYLLTHVVVESVDNYADEIESVYGLLNLLIHNIKTAQPNPEQHSTIAEYAGQAGKLAGTMISQMNPFSSKLDLDFIGRIDAMLLECTNGLNPLIARFLHPTETAVPDPDRQRRNQERLELATAAGQQLSKTLKYSFQSLSHALTNIMSLYKEVTLLSEKIKQEYTPELTLARTLVELRLLDSMQQLKHEYLPKLFAFVDKIEIQLMLKTGRLSTPLMENINAIYARLCKQIGTVITEDLLGRNKTLFQLEDMCFLSLRLAPTTSEIQQSRMKIKQLALVINELHSILNQNPNDLTQQRLETFTAKITPYIHLIDDQLDTYIMQGSANWGKYFGDLFRQQKSNPNMTNVLSNLRLLRKKIEQMHCNEKFKLELHSAMFDSIHQKSQLNLCPYDPRHDLFIPTEDSVLLATGEIINDAGLTNLEKRHLHQSHMALLDRLNQTRLANDFLIRELDSNPNLHNRDQLPENIRKDFLRCCAIVQSCLPELKIDENIISVDLDPQLRSLQVRLLSKQTQLRRRITSLNHHMSDLSQQEFVVPKKAVDSSMNVAVNESRKQYLIKHTAWSTAVTRIESSLHEYIEHCLNPVIVENLIRDTQNEHFPDFIDPELELNKKLAEPNQFLALKLLTNIVYSLKHLMLELEKMNDNETRLSYIAHVFSGYIKMQQAMSISIELANNPYLKQFYNVSLNKLTALYTTAMDEAALYIPVETSDPIPGIALAINVLDVLPGRIKPNRNAQAATRSWAENTMLDITSIIKTYETWGFSGLIGLPSNREKIIGLLISIRNKAQDLTTTISNKITDDLSTIRIDMGEIILALDSLEDQLSLKPGLLTGPMQTMLDPFYLELVASLVDYPATRSSLIDINNHEQRLTAARMRQTQARHAQDLWLGRMTVINHLTANHLTKSLKVRIQEWMDEEPDTTIQSLLRGKLETCKYDAIPALEVIAQFQSYCTGKHSAAEIAKQCCESQINYIEQIKRNSIQATPHHKAQLEQKYHELTTQYNQDNPDKLQEINLALAAFTQYLEQAQITVNTGQLALESSATIRSKQACIQELERIARDNTTRGHFRLKRIKTYLNNNNGHNTKILLECNTQHTGILNYLRLCVTRLLIACGLYTPQFISLTTNLGIQANQDLADPGECAKVIRKQGLFAFYASLNTEQPIQPAINIAAL